MELKLYAILLTFTISYTLVNGEIYTSTETIKESVTHVKEVLSSLSRYIETAETKLELLKRFVGSLQQKWGTDDSQSPDSIAGNPLEVYRFTKTFSLDWEHHVTNNILNNDTQDLIEEIEALRTKYLPGKSDMNGVMDSLIRLQETFELSSADLARGRILHVQAEGMTVDECYDIAQYAYSSKWYIFAAEWFRTALDKLDSGELCSITREEIKKMKIWSDFQRQQEEINYQKGLEKYIEIVPLEKKQFAIKTAEKAMSRFRQTGIIRTKPGEFYKNFESSQNYEKLCRGEETQDYKEKHYLVCRYRTNDHPLLYVQPAKEEELYLDPFVAIYHDVASNREMDTLKELSSTRMKRSRVVAIGRNGVKDSDARISRTGSVSSNHVLLQRLDDRVAAITGMNLNANTSEIWQVVNYGIGGQYEAHNDWLSEEQVRDRFQSVGIYGNRLVTFLLYLSDVEAGGATVFPNIGVKVPAVKGSAAFWYNLDATGSGLDSAQHGGCPVLLGNKWVANKWIHESAEWDNERAINAECLPCNGT